MVGLWVIHNGNYSIFVAKSIILLTTSTSQGILLNRRMDETSGRKGESMNKKVTRLYTGPDGESHFEDIEIPLMEKEGGVWVSQGLEVKLLFFRDWKGDRETGWHTAPRKQLVITLEGAEEIEVGDGTRRTFGPGDILLAEDTTGRGHKARSINQTGRKGISIALG
jgi:hypothetical protein